jgi:YbbR domain-containing protein
MQLPPVLTQIPRKPDLGKIRPWLQGAVTRNMGFKALAVIFALSGWGLVQGQQVVEQKARVQLHWLIPEGLALVGKLPDSISLTASGSQVFVRDLRRADLQLRVDLTDASAGFQSVEFEDRFIEALPQNVNVVGLSPARVEFELDEKVTKQVKISAEIKGDPGSGFRLVGVELSPATVQLEGPASVLVGISEIPTSPIDASGFDQATREEILLGRLPAGVVRVDERPIMVQVELEPISTTASFEAVPVLVRTPGWTTDVETVSITVSGPVPVVESLRTKDATITITVSPDAEPGPLQAKRAEGPARIDVVLSNLDRVTIDEMVPSVIEVRPVQ